MHRRDAKLMNAQIYIRSRDRASTSGELFLLVQQNCFEKSGRTKVRGERSMPRKIL